jgi:hypothetical protein
VLGSVVGRLYDRFGARAVLVPGTLGDRQEVRADPLAALTGRGRHPAVPGTRAIGSADTCSAHQTALTKLDGFLRRA